MIGELKNIARSKESTLEEKEEAVLEIFRILISKGDYHEIGSTIISLKGTWEDITTPRITKIIRRLFEMIPYSSENFGHVLELLTALVEWADKENKKMLRLDLECKRIYALLKTEKYSEALSQIGPVAHELKKYDDKINLITLYVYESKAFYEIKNISKSKSSLTSARVLAVSAYCPPQLQAQIDLLSGIYICDERNYGVASSYFIEALEGFTLGKMETEACISLRYLILSKIMAGKREEISTVMRNKNTLKHLDDEIIKVLLSISESFGNRDLKSYSDVLQQYSEQLNCDSFIWSHLQYLYDILLDRNIIKIIEPYSVVRINFIANALGFEADVIERKLRKMILDRVVNGTLDHIDECLILHGERADDDFADECMKQVKALDCIVSSRY
ncbi:proteasome regulatory complex component [Encephalitozoon hellem]|uniref:Proteasome regulatory complex component n=1 Tax=Encephalitozoon hellem TaxID=27973 RepID=A0ABY8CMU9_ENCHE|nr:proteasome regulatory complex component [Encephalitozoon hellem]